MRFYDLKITNAPAGEQSIEYTSFVNGQVDPGALDIEIDVPSTFFASPIGPANIKVFGVSLQTIAQATDLNGANVTLSAGMSKGLPLANPAQQGLILEGQVFQAFGNWVGTEMWLELNIYTNGGATNASPANLTFTWAKGTTLDNDIKQTLQTAYPDSQVDVKIMSLTATQDEVGCYNTMEEFASFVLDLSQTLNTDPSYGGVQVARHGKVIEVSDGTIAPDTKNILFQDLIGQPTWIGPSKIQFNCPIRADIAVGDRIQMPKAVTTATQAEQSAQAADRSQFQGQFTVAMVRHVGRFREPHAESWITTFNANALDPSPVSTQ
jgi:hypothetical protein